MILEHRNRKGVHSSITWAGGVKQATWAGITLVSNLGWRRSQTSCLGRHHASFGPNNTLGRRWAWACLGSPDDSRRLLAEEERNGERRRARRADGRRVAAHELDTAELPRTLHRHRRRRRASCDAMAPEPDDDLLNEKNPRPLDEDDIALLKTYVSAPPDRIGLHRLFPLSLILLILSWFTARVWIFRW